MDGRQQPEEIEFYTSRELSAAIEFSSSRERWDDEGQPMFLSYQRMEQGLEYDEGINFSLVPD